jgi:tetraacyldisaccharide 4'-kinase
MNKRTIKIIQKILFPVLLPIAGVYWAAITIKKFLYAAGILKIKKVPATVISIGNITVGGTGKTPMTIELAQKMLKSGFKPAIVIRGYGRKTKTPPDRQRAGVPVLVVSDGSKILAGVDEAGDEAYMMAKELPGVPVIVSPDKAAGAVYASKDLNANIILLDDGFQHLRLHRDADIVLVDCLDPFAGGFLIPFGLLREPVSSLRRASLICLTNYSDTLRDAADAIEARIKKSGSAAPIIRLGYKVTGFRNLSTGERVELGRFKDKVVNAVCALGNPDSFKKSLESAGINISKYNIYPDHHFFTIDEILKILENNVITVTSGKDAVRIEPLIGEIPGTTAFNSLYVQEICLEIISGKEIWERFIKETLPYSLTGTAPL